MDPQFQQALTAFFQAMTTQVQAAQAQAPAAQPAQPARRAEAHAPRSRVKTRNPDPYDGSDPAKLRAYLSQCKLVFRSRPDDFVDDQVKITYAVSWLTGTALRWYEPNLALDDEELPEYALVWDEFEEALRTTFGEADPVATATQKLDNLTMKDTHHITRYNVDFNEYSTITGFDERALYAKYYKGLAPRIKDGLVYGGKPDNLADLRAQAQALDSRYWERRDEDRFKPISSTPQKPVPASSSSTSSSSQAPTTSQQRNTPRASTPAASSSAKTDISSVLGPDGKLLPKEKERRCKNNLCLICGSKYHYADKCCDESHPSLNLYHPFRHLRQVLQT